jgi:hypothetical protein
MVRLDCSSIFFPSLPPARSRLSRLLGAIDRPYPSPITDHGQAAERPRISLASSRVPSAFPVPLLRTVPLLFATRSSSLSLKHSLEQQASSMPSGSRLPSVSAQAASRVSSSKQQAAPPMASALWRIPTCANPGSILVLSHSVCFSLSRRAMCLVVLCLVLVPCVLCLVPLSFIGGCGVRPLPRHWHGIHIHNAYE